MEPVMQLTPFPSEYYDVFAKFTHPRNHRETTVWGNLSDGPCTRTEALDAVSDWFAKRGMPQPTIQNVRVMHIQADVPARDVTEDVLAELAREMTDAEAAEQDACNRADDACKLAREEAA
jgi:hypothetical protein